MNFPFENVVPTLEDDGRDDVRINNRRRKCREKEREAQEGCR